MDEMLDTQRVKSLVYRVTSGEDTIYKEPAPLEVDTEKWKGCLDNGILTCHMKAHYSSVAVARKEVERYLRAWEIDAAIAFGRGSIAFVYQNAEVLDLTPRDRGDVVIHPQACEAIALAGTVNVILTRTSYPPPPKIFTVSPDVESLWHRYEGYLDGKEPLLSTAYFCLTTIEEAYGQGDRQASAHAMNVDPAILSMLGRLTSTKGDSRTARKAPRRGDSQPLSGTECAWIQAAVKMLIHRAGEHAACSDSSALPKIGMSDFPPLE